MLLWERLESHDWGFCASMVIKIQAMGRGISQNMEAAENLLVWWVLRKFRLEGTSGVSNYPFKAGKTDFIRVSISWGINPHQAGDGPTSLGPGCPAGPVPVPQPLPGGQKLKSCHLSGLPHLPPVCQCLSWVGNPNWRQYPGGVWKTLSRGDSLPSLVLEDVSCSQYPRQHLTHNQHPVGPPLYQVLTHQYVLPLSP